MSRTRAVVEEIWTMRAWAKGWRWKLAKGMGSAADVN